jgi:hypothetical protein
MARRAATARRGGDRDAAEPRDTEAAESSGAWRRRGAYAASPDGRADIICQAGATVRPGKSVNRAGSGLARHDIDPIDDGAAGEIGVSGAIVRFAATARHAIYIPVGASEPTSTFLRSLTCIRKL